MLRNDRFAGEIFGIFGDGVTARGVKLLLKKLNLEYIIYDKNSATNNIFSDNNARQHKFIIASPSFLPHHQWVQIATKNHCKILTEIELAQHFTNAKIFAITGTNGKTTTTKFLSEFFTHNNFTNNLHNNINDPCTHKNHNNFTYNNITAYAAGNIGLPLCELLATKEIYDDDIIFYEMSSFQAASITNLNLSGIIWTNYYPSHLNVHASEHEYLHAKYNLLNFLTTKIFIYGESVAEICNKNNLPLPEFTQICTRKNFNSLNTDEIEKNFPQNNETFSDNKNNFYDDNSSYTPRVYSQPGLINSFLQQETEQLTSTSPQKKESLNSVSQKYTDPFDSFTQQETYQSNFATHNYACPFNSFPQQENFQIIKQFCEEFCKNYSEIYNNNINRAYLEKTNVNNLHIALDEFAKHFTLPKYRLEFLGKIAGNFYWNDSKCTNFHALQAALNNFSEPVIWIGGGRSKGENLSDIIPIVRNKVEIALLIGEVAESLENLLKKYNICAINIKSIENLKNFIKKACILNKNVVLSPSFASFDQFSSFEERGKFFEKIVLELKNE